jgi:hypothetical protein
MFFHHPDNWITIENKEKNITIPNIPLDLFQKWEPDYNLPSPWAWRQYIQGKRHIVNDGENQSGNFVSINQKKDNSDFPLEWKRGDYYISRASVYQHRINNPEKTLEQEKQLVMNSINDIFDKEIGEGFEWKGERYPFCDNINDFLVFYISKQFPENFKFTSKSGYDLTFNKENAKEFIEFLNYSENKKYTLFDSLKSKSKEVDNCTEIKQLKKITLNL